MKRLSFHSAIAAFLVAAVLIAALTSCASQRGAVLPSLDSDKQAEAGVPVINPDSEMRGVWIASVFNIDFPSRPDLDGAALSAELDSILDTCAACGLNTVFFQIRPSCDALYRSDLYPVSRNLSSADSLTFDPLEYLLREAHRRNIFVHAWVNPLRVTVTPNSESTLPDNSPARRHPEWTVKYGDGKLYLNAGLPEVRDFVAAGVREIVERYDVDGVVFDDYFYPYPVDGADFDDGDAFSRYGSGDIADWRRSNINSLVEACGGAVHEADPDCRFGVSPGGVWRNDDGLNGGSPTRGFETYTSLYCDSLAWVRGGYIDYISPQLYWQMSSSATPFDELIRWWNRALEGTDVALVISHGAYRYEEGDWDEPSGEMSRQVCLSREMLSYSGSVFYGYDEIRGNARGISDELTAVFAENIVYYDPIPTGGRVSFTSHGDGDECPIGEITITGESDPTLPLYFDGAAVGRQRGGRFEIVLTLSRGENTFVFTQDGVDYSLTLRGTS